MKTFLNRFALLFVLIASASAQYGIPDDDDDHLPPANYVHDTSLHRVQKALAAPVSYTRYEDETPYEMKEYSPKIDIRKEQSASIYSVMPAPQPQQRIPIVQFQAESVPSLSRQAKVLNFETVSQPVKIETYTPEDMNAYIRSFETAPPSSTSNIRFSGDYTPQHTSYGEVRSEAVPIVKYVMDSDHRGTFRMETLTGDGTVKIINGQLKHVSTSSSPVVVKSGTYSYTGDDGKLYRVDWKADEDGYQATGDHLPK